MIAQPLRTTEIPNVLRKAASQRKIKLNKNWPTPTYIHNFLRRHKGKISRRKGEFLNKAAAAVDQEDCSSYKKQLKQKLTEMGHEGILLDPRRIYNGDETCLALSQGSTKLILSYYCFNLIFDYLDLSNLVITRGSQNCHQASSGTLKSCVTVTITANAAGELLDTQILCKSKMNHDEFAEGCAQKGCEFYYNIILIL
jgi:hypothetical protein